MYFHNILSLSSNILPSNFYTDGLSSAMSVVSFSSPDSSEPNSPPLDSSEPNSPPIVGHNSEFAFVYHDFPTDLSTVHGNKPSLHSFPPLPFIIVMFYLYTRTYNCCYSTFFCTHYTYYCCINYTLYRTHNTFYCTFATFLFSLFFLS